MTLTTTRYRPYLVFGLLLMIATIATPAAAQPAFVKTFLPDTIGPGSVSTLRFQISNLSLTSPATGLAFTDALPAGMTIAAVTNLTSSCDGTLLAPAGGTAISLSSGRVGASSSCVITLDVTSTTPGAHTNTTSSLSSSLGTAAPASATLTVAADRPGFTKSFSPASAFFGDRSSLTFTIDNTLSTVAAANLTFTDALPSGISVANPASASTTCTGGTITASPGSGVISYSPAFFGDAAVGAGSSCTVTVSVLAGAVGVLANTTGELTSTLPTAFTPRSSGKASAALTVSFEQVALTKVFSSGTVAPGSTVTMQLTVRNLDRRFPATDIAFTDDLDAMLPGLVAIGLPLVDPCGPGSSLSGTDVISLTGASLDPEASCSLNVVLQVPSSAPSGTFINTTSAITATVGGSTFIGSPGTAALTVETAPVLTAQLSGDPVGGGGTVTLTFELLNTSSSDSATTISFDNDVPPVLQAASSLPASGFCGAGSTATFTLFPSPRLVVAGAELAPGASCTFSADLDVVEGAPAGIYTSTTSSVAATVAGQPVTGLPASYDLQIVAAPLLYKQFLDDPVAPGDTVTLELTLVHDENAPGTATGISFSDDLAATLSGLQAIGLPAADVCGIGSSLTGTSTIQLSSGSLEPGSSCTFTATLQVPTSASPGAHLNTTSNVVATVLGAQAVGYPASDELDIAGLKLTKTFLGDPVQPGAPVTLRFTVANISPSAAATDIAFTDNLDNVVDGLAATGLPLADVCGTGSSFTGAVGDTLLNLQGGTLGAGETCTFDVTLQVPATAAADTYVNITSQLTATIDGQTIPFDSALDLLTISSDLLQLTKEFIDDPVAPGDPVTLRFTLTNLDPGAPASDLAFTDDLDATLTGLVSTSGTLADVCGAGSELTGTDLLALSGGSLPAGGSCTFDVSLAVPPLVPIGTTANNTTSQVTGTIGGIAATGAPASDELQINLITFTKAFAGDAFAGDTATLVFTLTNLSTSDGIADLGFTDDLDAMIPGLEAVGLPAGDVCGTGSTLAGTSFLLMTGARLAPGGSCTFSVDVAIPAATPAGSYVNITSDLGQGGASVAGPAEATLHVLSPVLTCPSPGTVDYGGYTAAACTPPGDAVIVTSKTELDAYLVDFGFDGTHVRSVDVRFNPTGTVVIISPCDILLKGQGGYLDIDANLVCAYGRRRVMVGGMSEVPGQGITAESVELLSEEGDTSINDELHIVADDVSAMALRRASVGFRCELDVLGDLRVVSFGDLHSSDAVIGQRTQVAAGSMLVSATRNAMLDTKTVIDVVGTLDLRSTGAVAQSMAEIKPNSLISAGTINQISGNRARIGGNATINVVGNYHMDAARKCIIAASATINAGSTSGSCLP